MFILLRYFVVGYAHFNFLNTFEQENMIFYIDYNNWWLEKQLLVIDLNKRVFFCTKKLYENSNVFQSSRITGKVKPKSYQYNLNPLITGIIKKLRLPNFMFEQCLSINLYIFNDHFYTQLDQWYGNSLWLTDLLRKIRNNFILVNLEYCEWKDSSPMTDFIIINLRRIHSR